MVVIPPGQFLMGSLESEAERRNNERLHEVTIYQPFALASEALTFARYNQFAKATKRRDPAAGLGLSGLIVGSLLGAALTLSNWNRDRPLINISCEDAMDFCAWLSQQTGQQYRLPTEAEWEFACRAGTTTAFWWGDEISTWRGNYDSNHSYCNGAKDEYPQKTLPVRSFEPNPWGLYQMHGNVWEWTASDWSADYSGQELLPGQGNDSARVVRGDGWDFEPAWVRSAARDRGLARVALNDTGFRLARTF